MTIRAIQRSRSRAATGLAEAPNDEVGPPASGGPLIVNVKSSAQATVEPITSRRRENLSETQLRRCKGGCLFAPPKRTFASDFSFIRPNSCRRPDHAEIRRW